MERPKGKFWCPACKKIWDESEIIFASYIGYMGKWTCGNPFCDVPVQKIEEKKKKHLTKRKKI